MLVQKSKYTSNVREIEPVSSLNIYVCRNTERVF